MTDPGDVFPWPEHVEPTVFAAWPNPSVPWWRRRWRVQAGPDGALYAAWTKEGAHERGLRLVNPPGYWKHQLRQRATPLLISTALTLIVWVVLAVFAPRLLDGISGLILLGYGGSFILRLIQRGHRRWHWRRPPDNLQQENP